MMVDGKTKIDSGDFWCKCQMNAVNDDKSGVFRDYKVGEVVTCCTAHLAEGLVFPCRYSSRDVVYDSSRPYHQGLSIPRDEDFEPVPGKVEWLREHSGTKRGPNKTAALLQNYSIRAGEIPPTRNLLAGSVMTVRFQSKPQRDKE